jgi:hypothetical protein
LALNPTVKIASEAGVQGVSLEAHCFEATGETTMKKLLLLALAAAGVLFAKKKLDEGQRDQALWAEATDTVERG